MMNPAELRVSLSRTLRPGALDDAVPRFAAGGRPVLDAVPDAGHGGDDPRFTEPFTQPGDRDAHGVGERIGVLVPGPFQQLLSADDTALGGHQHFQYGELLASQRDMAAVAVDLPAERIQAQARDLPDGRAVVCTPAVERSESQHELAELERLREVVVGPEPEPGRL